MEENWGKNGGKWREMEENGVKMEENGGKWRKTEGNTERLLTSSSSLTTSAPVCYKSIVSVVNNRHFGVTSSLVSLKPHQPPAERS